MIRRELIRDVVMTIMKRGEVKLPRDVKDALKKAFLEEKDEIAGLQLEMMMKNMEFSEISLRPLCQDTGTFSFFVRIGNDVMVDGTEIEAGIKEGITDATKEVPLRRNVVDPITRTEKDTEICVYYSFFEGNYLEITVLFSGGGAENMSTLEMLTPSEDVKKRVKEFVLDLVREMGGKPCPPIILGIGIGGCTSDLAMRLSKEALLVPVGVRNTDGNIADMERELIEEINKSGIGPMGLGGETTVLDVHIKKAGCHVASLPVAVSVQCWVARRASARIYNDGRVEYI